MKSIQEQRGGFVLGLIVGLLLGLAVALGVALYVTKVPVPLMNKTQARTPEQDAAEAQKNKGWDPNAALAGKNAPHPVVPSPSASGASGAERPAPLAEGQRPPPALPVPKGDPAASAAARAAAAASDAGHPARDPAAILNGGAADKSPAGGADNYTYWVQVGAYAKPEDAEQQRAKLAMQGFSAKVSERDQNGHPVHRVRLGPFDTKEEAESQQARVKPAEPEASLVRVEKPKT